MDVPDPRWTIWQPLMILPLTPTRAYRDFHMTSNLIPKSPWITMAHSTKAILSTMCLPGSPLSTGATHVRPSRNGQYPFRTFFSTGLHSWKMTSYSQVTQRLVPSSDPPLMHQNMPPQILSRQQISSVHAQHHSRLPSTKIIPTDSSGPSLPRRERGAGWHARLH